MNLSDIQPVKFPIQAMMLVSDTRETYTGTGWKDRTLDAVELNQIPGASLAGGQFTLPVGKYLCTLCVSSNRTEQGQEQIYNITDSASYRGMCNWFDSSGGEGHDQSMSTMIIEIAASKVFKIQSYVGTNDGSRTGEEDELDSQQYGVTTLRILRYDDTV